MEEWRVSSGAWKVDVQAAPSPVLQLPFAVLDRFAPTLAQRIAACPPPLSAPSVHIEPASPELHAQLAVNTSHSKKRRITRQAKREHSAEARSNELPLDQVLPSTEDDQDLSFSFSTGLNTPVYDRGDSLLVSGVPSRLQTHGSSFTATDDASSAASSPCAASADLSIDNDRLGDLSDSGPTLQLPDAPPARSQSPYVNTTHKALMGGAADFPERSSSPLKRRASSMEPEQSNMDLKGEDDVDMITAPAPQPQEDDSSQATLQGDLQGDPEPPVVPESTPQAQSELPLRNDIPPLEQQVKAIEALVKAFADAQPKEGDEAYLVSRQWLGRAQALGADTKHANLETPTAPVGPVDNSDIIQAVFTDSAGQGCVQLKHGMGTEHFELFPVDAWTMLLSWYGLAPGQPPIIRKAHNTAPDAVSLPNIQFEFHPPIFTIHRLWSATSTIPIEQEVKHKRPPPPVIMQSTSFAYHNFLKQAKSLTGVAADRKVRVWRILQTLPTVESQAPRASGIGTPPDSPGRVPEIDSRPPVTPGAWPEMLVDVETFLKLERDVERALVDAEDTTTNANYNGKKSLALVGLTVNETLVLDEYVDRDHNVSTFKGVNAKDKTLTSRGSSGSLAAQNRVTASGRSSPALQGPLTRGRTQQKSGRTIGCAGLQNLGNTCYMNSALQCVRSVEELTKYFLTHEAEKEINPDNPLSHNGDVARAYGRLLEEIYKDPPPNSVQPRHFKSIVGRYAPAFSGYGQQDSQEFVGFLLDGLQEDLNRIKQKPYIEKPDSTDDMIGNPAAIREMAEKVWDITKKRDDSVIADLFTGMYQSTLVCPACDKVSITFDPFNNLTLPLPIASVWSKSVRYFPLNDTPVDIVVDIDRNSSNKALKQYISSRVGVPVDRLIGAEEFREKFFKFYDDGACVSEDIQNNDNPTFHELEVAPTNTAAIKNPKKQGQRYRSLLADSNEVEEAILWEDAAARCMVVPVIHRFNPEPSGRKAYRKQDPKGMPPPHFIVLSPTEARSEDIIRRKILEKMATYSTWSEFADAAAPTDDESDTEETTDPEIVNSTSDADSAGDAKVVAKSIEGEEDIVDVTMRDAADGHEHKNTGEYPHLLKTFNQQRPRWIDPSQFLDPRFQGLFELSYYSDPGGGTALPTGWNSVQDDIPYPRLNTRQPKPETPDVEMRSPGHLALSDESGSESLGTPQMNAQTRMADTETSDDDSEFPKIRNLPAPRTNGQNKKSQVNCRGRGKNLKSNNRNYSKKAKNMKRSEKQQRAAPAQQSNETHSEDLSSADDGPLVRLGEGIIVDWHEEAFETVFGGTSADDERGMKTYNVVETIEDPIAEARKKQRQLRRKNGISLDDCLAEFEKEEVLSEQDTWYCPRCKEHRRATKKFDLWKTPDILVVHLKRFSSSGYRRDKLDVLVDFPVEGLDLTNRVINTEEGKEEIYDLIGVDNHWGGLGGGHYTAFAKNFIDGEWYEYNDASVSRQKDPSRVVGPGAYLLFYRRRSTVPLGGPKFQEIFDRFDAQNSYDDEAGEGRRLGQGSSSMRGSPSASTGADLILPRGSRGSASGMLADEELPSYQAGLSRVGEADDDTEMVTQAAWESQQGTLRNSIEADEAIDLPDYNVGMAGMTSNFQTNWSFANLPGARSEAGMDDDIASDVAEGDDSSIDGDRYADAPDGHEGILMNDVGPGYIDPDEPPQTTFSVYDPPASIPREQQEYMTRLAVQTWEQKVHTIPADVGDDQPSEQVTEIRIEDDHEQALPREPRQSPKA